MAVRLEFCARVCGLFQFGDSWKPMEVSVTTTCTEGWPGFRVDDGAKELGAG